MAETELKAFLDVAEELKVLGLTDTSAFKRDLGLSGTKTGVKEKESPPSISSDPAPPSGSNLHLNTGNAAGRTLTWSEWSTLIGPDPPDTVRSLV